MKISFLGTRGNIDAKTRRHKRHTITMVSYKRTRVMIDCGLDWRGKFEQYKPDAIFITHAHPDHADGLKDGAPCPVYATKESWELMKKFPIEKKHVVRYRKPFTIGSLRFEAFFVIHSLRAPAVGYRITAEKKIIFVVHDLISIKQRRAALKDVQLYIGDGASITRPIIRRKDSKLFGHTTIRAQLGWCETENVPHAIFTHCGSQIVKGDERVLGAKVRKMGKERGVDASIAYDGLEVKI